MICRTSRGRERASERSRRARQGAGRVRAVLTGAASCLPGRGTSWGSGHARLVGPHGGRIAGERGGHGAPGAGLRGHDRQPPGQDPKQTLHLVSAARGGPEWRDLCGGCGAPTWVRTTPHAHPGGLLSTGCSHTVAHT